MKGLILGLGRFLIDLGSFIQLSLVIVLSVVAGNACGSYNSGTQADFIGQF